MMYLFLLNLIVLLFLCYPNSTYGMIGYDCRHPHLSYTIIDGITVKECNMNKTHVTSTHQNIQLLQRNPILTTKTYRCYIMITKTIFRCGMHSHTVAVKDGFYTYMYEPSYDECIRMVNDRTVKLFGRVISSEIKLNSKHRFNVMLTGAIHNDDTCEGGTYTFMDKTYYKAVVQAQIEVLFSEQDGKVEFRLDSNFWYSYCLCTGLSLEPTLLCEGARTNWNHLIQVKRRPRRTQEKVWHIIGPREEDWKTVTDAAERRDGGLCNAGSQWCDLQFEAPASAW
uniref:Putative secreted protein n=1 Tax=Panstrongylus lignarius TaxID=156445 RepID=A0A224XHD4_9HEMI